MLQSLTITHTEKSRKDLELLGRLLTAVGLGEGAVSRSKTKTLTFVPSAVKLELADQGGTAITLQVSDLAPALAAAKKLGLKISDSSDHDFHATLPGGTIIAFTGPSNEERSPGIAGNLDSTGKHFAAVVARFNSFITERLLEGALDALVRTGAKRRDIQIVRVPGAFEIPAAARALAQTKKFDAVVCIGCLLRGDTAHYDVIVNEVTRGIGQSAQETGVPHAFGVLTCDTLEQAIDRAGLKMGNKGFEAGLAAVEMASLKKQIKSARKSRR